MAKPINGFLLHVILWIVRVFTLEYSTLAEKLSTPAKSSYLVITPDRRLVAVYMGQLKLKLQHRALLAQSKLNR